MRLVRRLLLGVVLLALLGGMMVHYGAVRDDHFPYTPTKELRDGYSRHVGEETYFWAEVTAVGEGRFEVANFALNLTVIGPTEGVDPGDVVQVSGTIKPDRTIAARRVIVSDRGNRLYMFGVSGLAVFIVVVDWWRFWWVDWRTLTIRRREDES